MPKYKVGDILHKDTTKIDSDASPETIMIVEILSDKTPNAIPSWLKQLYKYLILQSTNPHTPNATIDINPTSYIDKYYMPANRNTTNRSNTTTPTTTTPQSQ
jgi:hypothetical protein